MIANCLASVRVPRSEESGGSQDRAELMGGPFLRAQQMQNLVPLKGAR